MFKEGDLLHSPYEIPADSPRARSRRESLTPRGAPAPEVVEMLEEACLSSAAKRRCLRHAKELARGELLLLKDMHAVKHFARQRLGFDTRDAEDVVRLHAWIQRERTLETDAAEQAPMSAWDGVRLSAWDGSAWVGQETRFEYVEWLQELEVVDPGHYQGGGVVSYIATDSGPRVRRGSSGLQPTTSRGVWTNPHTAARMVVSCSSVRNGHEGLLTSGSVQRALGPHSRDKKLLCTADRRGSWMQLDLASRRASANSAQILANSSSPGGSHRQRIMRRLQVDHYVLVNSGLGRVLGRWQLQGANEETDSPDEPGEWFVLHEGEGMPREDYAGADFDVQVPHEADAFSSFYRFFRVVQLGRNVGCNHTDSVRHFLADLNTSERQITDKEHIGGYAAHSASVVKVLSSGTFAYEQSDFVSILQEMQRSKQLGAFLAACLKPRAVERVTQFLPHTSPSKATGAAAEVKVRRRAAWDSDTEVPGASVTDRWTKAGWRPIASKDDGSRGGNGKEADDDQPLPPGTEVYVKPGHAASRYLPTAGRAPGVVVQFVLPEARYAIELNTGDRLWPVHPDHVEDRASFDGDYRLCLNGFELYGTLREQRKAV